jgi:hypothetical protein
MVVMVQMLDSLAWYTVRLLGLIQNFIGETIMQYYKPNPNERGGYEKFQVLLGMTFGGMALFHSKRPEDFPKIMSGKLLTQGRIIVLLVFFSIMFTVVQKLS